MLAREVEFGGRFTINSASLVRIDPSLLLCYCRPMNIDPLGRLAEMVYAVDSHNKLILIHPTNSVQICNPSHEEMVRSAWVC